MQTDSSGLGRRELLGGAAALALAPQMAAGRVAESRLAERLGAQLAALAAADDFAGTVLIAERGKIVFHRAYGLAERGVGARNAPDTRFNLASIGKMFTGLAVMRLVEAGKIGLDDRLVRHLPDYPNKAVAASVTIAQLLTHTAGIGNVAESETRAAATTLDRLSDYLPLFADKAPDFAPGERFAYSNMGYLLLGLVVEAATGEDYFDHIRRTIFAPLGMTGAAFLDLDIAAPKVATGYMRALDRPGEWQSNILTMTRRGSPAGGSYATATDLLRFADALVANRLLGAAATADWTKGRIDYPKGRYGYGVSEEVVNGHRIIGHSGGHYGIANELMIFEDLGITAVILTNCDVDAYFAIANWLKRELVGDSPATRAYWQTRAVIDATMAKGEAAGAATAKAQGGTPRESVIDLAGLKALHRRQDAAAVALLSLNRTLFPDSPGALWSLASAYRVMGRKDAARALYTDYLAKEPDDVDAKRALARL
jgi:D-alanyl-D-alanine carboxypeptidase